MLTRHTTALQRSPGKLHMVLRAAFKSVEVTSQSGRHISNLSRCTCAAAPKKITSKDIPEFKARASSTDTLGNKGASQNSGRHMLFCRSQLKTHVI